MKKYPFSTYIGSSLWLLLCLLFTTQTKSQTAGTMTFTVTTSAVSGSYGTKNLLAIWIEDGTTAFVKTKMKYGSTSNYDHFILWNAKSGGNVVDATTGATLATHGTRTVSWNATDVSGNLVPDGTYTLWVEMAWNSSYTTGRTYTSIPFTKGPASVHLTPANTANFANMVLDWTPVAVPNITTSALSINTYCSGAGINVAFTAGGASFTAGNVFTAQLSNALGSFSTPINIGTLTSTTSGIINGTIPAGTLTGTGYRVRVIGSSPSTTGTDNGTNFSVTSNVTPSVVISANPAGTICSGSSVTFTATPVNGGTATYQWKLNGANVGTNSSLFTNASLANGNTVQCVITSSLACVTSASANSNTLTMTVNPSVTPSVAIAANPAGAICSGSSVTFTATPVNGGTAAYQWKLDGANVGTNSSLYTNASLANGNTVQCVMTSSATCALPSAASSNTVTMAVNPVLTPAVSISANPSGSICNGTSVTFSATSVNGGTASYQWKLNGANVGTNTSVYTNASLANGNTIQCILTSNATCVTPATASSNIITQSIQSNVTPSVSITASASTICSGNPVTFTSTETNGGIPTYQWKLNGNNVGTNSSIYTNNSLGNGDNINCSVTTSLTCATVPSVNSNTVTMTVNPNVIPSLTITATEYSICEGTSVTFSATPVNGGVPPVYQWKLNNINTGTNSHLYTSSSLMNNDQIVCEMISSATCANPSMVNSNMITETVIPLLVPGVSISANPALTVCPGNTILFTPSPLNGGSPTYIWYVDGIIASITPTFSGVFNNGQVIYCNMTTTVSCPSVPSATSNPLTVNIFPVTPVSISEISGVLTSSAVSGNQWYEQTNGIIAGANQQTYVPLADGYYYSIVADQNGCTDTSNIINVVATSIEDNLTDQTVKIFPNPTNGLVTVELTTDALDCVIRINNALGAKIYEEKISQSGSTVRTYNLKKYPNGIYFVNIHLQKQNKDLRYKIILNK